MNGAGNDFVLIDNREGGVSLSREQIARLCHRQRGIGADGLILLRHATGDADWAWDFYNADGSDADMCGNGARCFARYLLENFGGENEVNFETACGVIRARIFEGAVTVNLTEPTGVSLNLSVSVDGRKRIMHYLNTGVPHVVLFVDDADAAMVEKLGKEIRHHEEFAPDGTNVNFVQVLKPGHIRVRTYERGVGETLACGTGVCASAMVAGRLNVWRSPVRVDVLGGDTLSVAFENKGDNFTEVWLTGPAEFVFEGTVTV